MKLLALLFEPGTIRKVRYWSTDSGIWSAYWLFRRNGKTCLNCHITTGGISAFGLLYFCEVSRMLSRTPKTSARLLLLFFGFPLLGFISWYDKELHLEIYTYPESLFRRNEDMDWIKNWKGKKRMSAFRYLEEKVVVRWRITQVMDR